MVIMKCVKILVLLTVFMLNCRSSSSKYTMDNSNTKIVGGVPSKPNEFPYVLSLYVGTSLCGASIVSEQWAVTAAHCFDKYNDPKTPVFVIAGDHTLSKPEKTEQRRTVTQIIIHEDFSKPQNDIALLKFASKLRLDNRTASTVAMPDSKYNASGLATLCGWGSTEENGQASDVLMKAKISILPDSTCENVYGSQFLAATMLCGSAGGIGSCRGDSGSPLVDSNGLIVGLVSGGKGCGVKPGKLAKFSSWIKKHSA